MCLDTHPDMNTEIVLPTAIKEKRLPATACVMANSPSIIGSRGEKDILTQKLRNQRLQKIKSRKIFMVAGYTLCRMNVQEKTAMCIMLPITHFSSFRNTIPYYLPINQNKIKTHFLSCYIQKPFKTTFKCAIMPVLYNYTMTSCANMVLFSQKNYNCTWKATVAVTKKMF